MTFIRKMIKIGDRVEAVKDIEIAHGTFTKGHIFKVVSCDNRGFNLIDDDGNECLEVPSEYIKRVKPLTQESAIESTVHGEE